MGLQPYADNDFYIKESRDMITIVQSMIIAGNYRVFSDQFSTIMIVATYFIIKHADALMTIASDSLFFHSHMLLEKKVEQNKVLRV